MSAQRTYSNEARERMRAGARKGGLSRAKAFTPDYQRAVASCKPSEQLARAGRAGWEALVAAKGVEYAARQTARWRREHPTSLELAVMTWLDEHDVSYEREAEIKLGAGVFFADFKLADGRLIEVDGVAWHGDDAVRAEQGERDRIRRLAIRDAGYETLHLTEAEIRDEIAWPMLSAWLQGEQP
jgi:very-short-patch-repair endonuclease